MMTFTKRLLIGAAAGALASAPASADIASEWWDLANRYSTASQGAPGPRTPDQERAATRATLAMFEAVNSIDPRYRSYFRNRPLRSARVAGRRSRDCGIQGAVETLSAEQVGARGELQVRAGCDPGECGRDLGVEAGDRAAAAAMDANGIDPAIEQVPFRPQATNGEWTATGYPRSAAYWPASNHGI